METTYDAYMEACLDYLESGEGEPPSPEGLSPEDRERARRWVRWLADSRNAAELVQAAHDLEARGIWPSQVE